jgi:hypothetical protein
MFYPVEESPSFIVDAAKELPVVIERIEMNVFQGFVQALKELQSPENMGRGSDVADLYDFEYQQRYMDVMEDEYCDGALALLTKHFTCDEAFEVMDELQSMVHNAYLTAWRKGVQRFYRVYPQWLAGRKH